MFPFTALRQCSGMRAQTSRKAAHRELRSFPWKYREFSPTTAKSEPRKIVRGRFKASAMRTDTDKKVL